MVVCWAGGSTSDSCLEIAAALAECLGLQEAQSVWVENLKNVNVATCVHLEPVSVDDWEIVVRNMFCRVFSLVKTTGTSC